MSEASMIVAAVDFRDSTPSVLERARRLQEAAGGQLLLLHVIPELKSLFGFYQGPRSVATLQRELEEESEDRMRDLLREIPGARSRIEKGFPPSTVYAVCKEEDADYLVVGAHNAETPQAKVLGGTADKILRDPPCPVLLVPAAAG